MEYEIFLNSNLEWEEKRYIINDNDYNFYHLSNRLKKIPESSTVCPLEKLYACQETEHKTFNIMTNGLNDIDMFLHNAIDNENINNSDYTFQEAYEKLILQKSNVLSILYSFPRELNLCLYNDNTSCEIVDHKEEIVSLKNAIKKLYLLSNETIFNNNLELRKKMEMLEYNERIFYRLSRSLKEVPELSTVCYFENFYTCQETEQRTFNITNNGLNELEEFINNIERNSIDVDNLSVKLQSMYKKLMTENLTALSILYSFPEEMNICKYDNNTSCEILDQREEIDSLKNVVKNLYLLSNEIILNSDIDLERKKRAIDDNGFLFYHLSNRLEEIPKFLNKNCN